MAIEAMSRFAHIYSDHQGLCVHAMEFADGKIAECFCPGSILQSGCQLLSALVHDCNTERIPALNAAGSLKAIAAAVRANPACADPDNPEGAFDPKASRQGFLDMNIIKPLVIRLIGLNDFTDVMYTETMMTLLGTKEQPGFLRHKMMAYMGKQGYEMDTTGEM